MLSSLKHSCLVNSINLMEEKDEKVTKKKKKKKTEK